MEQYFVFLNVSNVLDLITRSLADGIFEAAEALDCPYMIEMRNDLKSTALCAGIMGMFWGGEIPEIIRKSGIPGVNLSNLHGPIPGMGNVLSDDTEVGRMAARHLLSRGYRHFLGLGARGTCYSRERLSGFQEVLSQEGLTCTTIELDSNLRVEPWSPQLYQDHIWEQVRLTLRDMPMDTGVFVVSDWLAWPVLRSMEQHEPERLQTTGILGVDNLLGGRFDPRKGNRLSSINPGFREAGRLALTLLLEHVLHGRELQETLRVQPSNLIERASTAGPACADPLLAKIQRDIWQRIRKQQPVVLGDLARQNGMSSSTFEKKFQATMGKSARETVTDMRIDYAKQLLEDGKHPIGEIGYLCGYANPASFSNAFKSLSGIPPRDYCRCRMPSR